MLLNNWVVQTPMLWRDQQYENIIWTPSQVSLAASGGSKGRLQDSWSSKKRLPICFLTKKSEAIRFCAHFWKKNKWMCLTYTEQILRRCCHRDSEPDRAFIDGDTYIHSNANPSASIWATGVFAPHSSIAPGTCSHLFHQKMHLVGLNLTSCCE